MGDEVRLTAHHKIKSTVSMVLPFLVGGLISVEVHTYLDSLHVRSLMAFFGILSGFTITLMLFTGKVDEVNQLDVDDMREYRSKVIYLLWSQTKSLFVYIIAIGVCFIWLLCREALGESKADMDIFTLNAFNVSIFGLVVLSICRISLLPFQIFEVHKFSLDAMVTKKIQEKNERVKADREASLKSLKIDTDEE